MAHHMEKKRSPSCLLLASTVQAAAAVDENEMAKMNERMIGENESRRLKCNECCITTSDAVNFDCLKQEISGKGDTTKERSQLTTRGREGERERKKRGGRATSTSTSTQQQPIRKFLDGSCW